MTEIWQLSPKVDGVQLFYTRDIPIGFHLMRADIVNAWPRVTLELGSKNKRLKLKDIAGFSGPEWVNDKFKEKFEKQFPGLGTFLPAITPEGIPTYHGFVPAKTLDIIDWDRYPPGIPSYRMVDDLHFRPERFSVEDVVFFVRGFLPNPFVTRPFVDFCIENQISGAIFKRPENVGITRFLKSDLNFNDVPEYKY